MAEKSQLSGKVKSSGWNSMFQNPLAYGIKKHLFEVLKHRYADNEAIVEKLAAQTLTEPQYEEFGNFIAAIYEAGYLKAVDDHKEQLEKMGFEAKVVSKPTVDKKSSSLFPQEKSG